MQIKEEYLEVLDKLGWGIVVSGNGARLYHATSVLGSFGFRVGEGDLADLVSDYAIEFNQCTWAKTVLDLLPEEYVSEQLIKLGSEAEEVQMLLLRLGIALLKVSKTIK